MNDPSHRTVGVSTKTKVGFGGGFVSLVGAGSGRMEYLTVGALRRIKKAEVVLHDALVDREIFEVFPPSCEVIDVGKRALRTCPSKQEEILHLMAQYARRGLRVVRLKAGDPFVFGRGSEEGLFLEKMGIEFEVVPGLSSALLAPQVAGIPVTHRGLVQGLLVLSGHHPDRFEEIVRGLEPGSVTLVVLMGYRHRAEIRDLLLRYRWTPEIPVSLVAGAGQLEQREFRGRLSSLGTEPGFLPGKAPVTLVIGWTAALQIGTKLEASALTPA